MDIKGYHKAGELDSRRHTYLLDHGRRANQMDNMTINHQANMVAAKRARRRDHIYGSQQRQD